MMRLPLFAMVAAICAASYGCATVDSSSALRPKPATQADMVGTWRWVRATEYGQVHEIETPFFMRLYPDGTAATWPTPYGVPTRGEYKVEEGFLVQPPEGPDSIKAAVTMVGPNAWVMTTEEGHESEYHRVTPDLEPGKLP